MPHVGHNIACSLAASVWNVGQLAPAAACGAAVVPIATRSGADDIGGGDDGEPTPTPAATGAATVVAVAVAIDMTDWHRGHRNDPVDPSGTRTRAPH